MKKTTAATPTIEMTKQTITKVKNVVLEGVETLKADKITTTFYVKYRFNPNNGRISIISKNKLEESVEALSLHLTEVTPKKLAQYRQKGIPSFVLKVDGKFYHTRISKNINFVGSTIFGEHWCARPGRECEHLSAASDESGGCAKVRNFSSCIEKYPWITMGYETFNTSQDSFVVANCLRYERC